MRRVLCAVVAAGLIGARSGAEDQEMPIALDKLPKAVVDSLQKHFPHAKLEQATTEKEDDEVLFEVTFLDGAIKSDVTLDEDGEIEGIERSVELNSVPKAVTDLVLKAHPHATLKSAEAVYELEDGQEELEYYEVQVETAEKKAVEVKVKYEVEIIGDAHEDDAETEGK
jgi:hypothetical protein